MKVNIEDYRRVARRRLPRIFFDYLDGGASRETTMAANLAAFQNVPLTPRVLVDVSQRNLETQVAGANSTLPVMLGPVGFLGMLRLGGERAAFRAAARAGIAACLSSFSVDRLEDVFAQGASGAFQLYVLKDRERTLAILERARNSGIGTVFVTVDTSVAGRRERDLRNGFRLLSRPNLKLLADFACHPFWLADMARNPRPQLSVMEGVAAAGGNILSQATFLASQIDSSFDLEGFAWLRRQWAGRLIVKGIMCPGDARRAVDAGADGIVVSNHGGRQLDGAAASLDALPVIAAAVGGHTEVLFDGGIRSGEDVLKALALGADVCLLGRAYAYGLAAKGEAGVTGVLDIIRAQMDIAMALIGCRSIAEVKTLGRAALGG